MIFKRSYALITVVVIGLMLLACNFSFSTANVSDAWMSTDEDGKNRTTVFDQDAVFYAQVQVQNAPDDTKVKAVWTAVEVEDNDPNLKLDENELITGNDKAAKTLEFTVS